MDRCSFEKVTDEKTAMAQEPNEDPYDLKVLWKSTKNRSLSRSAIADAERRLTPGLVVGWGCIKNSLTHSILFYVRCETCARSFENCIWPKRVSEVLSAQEILKQTLLQYAPDCPHIGDALPDLAGMSPAELMPLPEKDDDGASDA
jgi:hypothetical protein